MDIGTIASQKYFNNVAIQGEADDFTKKLTQHFNTIGTLAFGQMKFICNEKQSNYNWTPLDRFIELSKRHDLKAHFNTVINNKYSFPNWFIELPPQDKIKALENHIKNVIDRHGENFAMYKLVNEMVRDEEENFLGTELKRTKLIADMFKWAKEVNPDVTLMINDFAVIVREDMRTNYINLINAVKDEGGPIDVVGIQAHLGHPSPYNTFLFQLPPDEMIHTALEEIHAKTGLPIHITEFDLSFNNSPQQQSEGSQIEPNEPFTTIEDKHFDNWWEYQAYAYRHFYEICQSKPFIECLTFWGFLDKDTFQNERPGTGFFDINNEQKPVYESLEPILKMSLNN